MATQIHVPHQSLGEAGFIRIIMFKIRDIRKHVYAVGVVIDVKNIHDDVLKLCAESVTSRRCCIIIHRGWSSRLFVRSSITVGICIFFWKGLYTFY